MTFKEWFIELFKDERNSTSIKPVVGFMGAVFLCITLTINSFNHDSIKPSDALVNAVLVITCVGIGADSIDKFSGTKKKEGEV